jgi:HK97 family phage major capsid protein
LEQQVRNLCENARGNSDAIDALKKVFGGHAPNGQQTPYIHGWAGDDGAQAVTVEKILAHGKRTKTTGGNPQRNFGDWLTWVAAGTCPTGCHGGADAWLPSHFAARAGCRDLSLVDKVMKDYGSPRGFVNQVSKAPNAESSGATGGYLVPTQFYMKLLQFVAEESFIKAACTTLPMQGRELRYPYLNQSATTASSASNFPASNFYGGVFFSWEPEAATYPQTNPGFQQGTLVARDLVGITVVSNQLLQDSAIALDSVLTTLFAEALAWQLDYAFLRGNGVNAPLGILNAPGTIASTRAANNNLLTSMSDMVGRAMNPVRDRSSYCWVISQSALPYLLRLTNGATNSPFLVWLNPAPGNGEGGPMARPWPATIFGIPVYFTEKLPVYGAQGDICLLDCSKYLCGDRMAIQVEASQFPYFTSNQMVWRVIWRGDGQPWFNAAVTLADGITTVSPHVILAA